MTRRLRETARNVLAVWGAVCLIAVIASAAFIAYSAMTNRTRDDRATKHDVRFVLNWPGLGDERIESVLHSHESAVLFGGDHFTAYAIRVTSLDERELALNRRWVRGDRADELMKEAVRFVTAGPHEAPWFPRSDDLLTDKYYVWRWRVEVNQGVSAAALIFARPSDRMIFYASLQV